MPLLNRTGEFWCSGIAGAGFWLGDFAAGRPRVLVHLSGGGDAGGRAWLNDEEALTVYHRGAEIRAYHARTHTYRVLDHSGATEIAAGGNVWMRFIAFHPGQHHEGTGVKTSTGLTLPEAYADKGYVGPDGVLAVKDRYHSHIGPWYLHFPDGRTAVKLADGPLTNLQLLGGDRAIWRDPNFNWFARGVPTPKPLVREAWVLSMVETAAGWVVVYFGGISNTEGLVVVHHNGSDVGKVVARTSAAYGLTCAVLPSGDLRLLWATTEGEAASDLVAHDVRLADLTERITFADYYESPQVPPPPPPPPQDNKEPHMPKPKYEPIPSREDVVWDVWNRCTPTQRLTRVFIAEQTAYELRARQIPAYWLKDGVPYNEPVPGSTPVTSWCVNQKRGNQGDSEDCISVEHPYGAGGWAIIDVIGGFDPDHGNPGTPSWFDQTQKTIDWGTVGGGRIPRNLLGAVVEPPPPPPTDDNPPGEPRDEPPPPVDDGELVRLLGQLLETNTQILETSRAALAHLEAIRGDIKHFTDDVKKHLPDLIKVLGTGSAGSILGGILGRR